MFKRITLLLILTISIQISAQKKQEEPTKWDVNNPHKDWKYNSFKLNTNEGTWMNLDVSPDGKTIVFDLLGDIYKMPITGGKATILRAGMAYEVQPKFSPNGKYISFTSDAEGGDNIWVMTADGKDAKSITKESFTLLNNAVWTPDGMSLVARKHFTSGRSLGAGEMWQYPLSGSAGLQLTKRKNDQQDVNDPSISSDGKYLYYAEDMYPGGFFQYNKDPNNQIYGINQYNFETGEITQITGGPGGAARPVISKDGKFLAFVKRIRTKSVLYIHELETGKEWSIYENLSKDQSEAWAIFGVYPYFSWTPDDKDILIWAQGKINKINIETRQITNIPFEVNQEIKLAKTHHVKRTVFEEEFTSKMIKDVQTSADEKTIIFTSLGHIYSKELPNGIPKRITTLTDFEAEPSFSLDEKSVLFVTWNDENLGAIYSVNLDGSGLQKITKEKGIYRTPKYNNAGSKITYLKESGNGDQGFDYTKKTGIYIADIDGSNAKMVSESGEFPSFSADDKRIFFQTGGSFFGGLTKNLKSVDLNGKDERSHFSSKLANRLVPSKDNKWIAFIHLHKLFVAPFVLNGSEINVDQNTKSFNVESLSKNAGINLHWASSNKVFWTLGDAYFSKSIVDNTTDPFAKTNLVADESAGIKINLKSTSDVPEGRIAFKNARIITMNGNEIIEEGTIIIYKNKIEKIGKTSAITVPSDAKMYDMNGKTIMPGMVDVHAHVGAFRNGLSTQKHWQFYANLAFGVTTSHDPSVHTAAAFTLEELQRSGQLVGPRMFSTGFILYGAEGDFKAVVNNLEDARFAIARTKAFGAKSIKSYNQPRREQRQQIMQAARELGVNVVPEGGSSFYANMSMIFDGHTGIEHNIPVNPVYKDVLSLWKNSKTGYTPTLIVNYGGMNGEFEWYQKSNVWENKTLLKYTPRYVIDTRSRHRTMVPEEEYINGHVLTSKTVTALANEGVKVNLGAHGQLQGLGAHWELWMLQQGGMSNHDALKAATINGADYIGAADEIGSLEKGKLADLIIMDKNPLEDIQNSNSVIYTMVNGRLYDVDTMNEIGNYDAKRSKFYFEMDGYNQGVPFNANTNSFTTPTCSCHN
ncbi:amidohydrolase family protein [Polaribacter glomeratus]|uniref:Amidohydrolase n=1 Tax=Polaribacter glomeratus TaxID=102 RepID=A0A2S7WYM1_9FLAO|nr:amidohydrolase family protein [Polaribacter glomeratus]PQJ82663.1 amidohydrolase [Polaribacter glomeratus]TXD64022.1 amidohydrolase family protein [Polaribacter glomeratus]